jgi:Cu/Ag efflux protein CusF
MYQHKSARQSGGPIKVLAMISVAALRSSAVTIAASTALALCLLSSTAALAASPCCGVTEIATNGQVTAREMNGTRTIVFQVTDAALLRALKPGAPVYANFDTKQVSLDGKKACCKILNIGTSTKQSEPVAAAAAPKEKPSGTTTQSKQTTVEVPKVDVTAAEGSTATASRGKPATSATGAKQPATVSNTAAANAQSAAINPAVILSQTLPKLSFGTWQDVQTTNWRDGPRSLSQFQNKQMIQLRGVDDIKKATGLPQAAKDILWLHARTLEAQEIDGYIVIPEKAEEWSRTLPDSVREKLRKAAEDDGKKKKKGCSTQHISDGLRAN